MFKILHFVFLFTLSYGLLLYFHAYLCCTPVFQYCSHFTVKLLDWGEDGMASAAETAALRASFKQEVSVWQKLDHPNVTKVNFRIF